MKEVLKWCIYKYPHHVFQRRKHPTAVVWLIISWNTVLVAWLLSSSVANYIAWPLPAWCITTLLRLAPLCPLPPRPPSSLFISLKSSPQTLRRLRPFLVHLISAAHKIWQLVKWKWQSPNLPLQFIKKAMYDMNIYYVFDCTFISGQKCQSANHRDPCEHMLQQTYSQARLVNSFVPTFTTKDLYSPVASCIYQLKHTFTAQFYK